METTTDTTHLSVLIDRQWSLLSTLRILAIQQCECLGADSVEVLLSILARKQPLIEELLQLQTELKPYRNQDPELRKWNDDAERERCQSLFASCEQLHQEIVRLESRVLTELECNRDAVAAQLQECRDATLAATAYSNENLLVEGSLDLTNS